MSEVVEVLDRLRDLLKQPGTWVGRSPHGVPETCLVMGLNSIVPHYNPINMKVRRALCGALEPRYQKSVRRWAERMDTGDMLVEFNDAQKSVEGVLRLIERARGMLVGDG